jgi:dihydrofolate reductase
MRRVTYSLGMSLDGYSIGPDGGFDWSAPDDELFRFAMDQLRRVDVHLMGRRLYESMLYWESADPGSFTDDEREWTAMWKRVPKVVFSRSLTDVRGTNTRLATDGLGAEIARLREEGDGEIAIGGMTLAAEAAALDVIDEYLPKLYPVLVGGGVPFFARDERRVDLELVETRTFPSGVVYLRQRVVR